MSVFLLLQALRDHLAPHLAAFPLASRQRNGLPPAGNEPEPVRSCSLFLGSMPPTVNEAASAAPFVVIQAMDGENDGDGLENIRVVLRVCIVADEPEAAENDLLNLLSAIRLRLLEAPGGCVGGGGFRMMPLEDGLLPWKRPDEQAAPFLQAFVFSSWQTRSAVKRPDLDMIDYE